MNADRVSSGDRRAVGSRFQVLGPYTAKLRWPVDVRHQEIPGDCRARLATAVRSRTQHTVVTSRVPSLSRRMVESCDSAEKITALLLHDWVAPPNERLRTNGAASHQR